MEVRRRKAAEQEAAARRALGPQIIEDSVKLIEAWNAREAAHSVDLRSLDWHRDAAVTALTPALSCRSCRPNAPFAEHVCLSKSGVAEEYYAERSGNRLVSE